MSLVVELKPEVEEALKKKAAAKGSAVDTYVRQLIEKDIGPGPTYEEVMAPLWKDFEESGMTDDELNELIEKERQAIWEEKQEKRV